MSYISIKEASEKWGISDSRIRLLCREGRIEGAIKIGRNWQFLSMQ
ncbi:MAG TPA: helix-turn-helix domain-containing protein [Tissierellales bacterium]|nr:helix-turn-helix domain-containing protein [Tissierellales bacterium]